MRLHGGAAQPRGGGFGDIVQHVTRATELKNLKEDSKTAAASWTIAVRKASGGDSDWQAVARRELDSLE